MRKKLKNQIQISVKDSFEAGISWDLNSAPARRISNLIGEMIALDNQPFILVEDLGFVRLMNVCPKYKMPSRQYFSDTVIPDLVKRAETAVEKLLRNARDISFTSDIWTCSYNNNGFISLTDHWVDWTEREG